MESAFFLGFNCLASVASIVSFIICLREMVKTTDPTPGDGRRRSLKYLGFSIALASLATYLALSIKQNIETLEQSGPLKQSGDNTIYYPIPYEKPPHLTFITERPDLNTLPEVQEQHADCFKVRFPSSLARELYSWKAVGVKPRNVK